MSLSDLERYYNLRATQCRWMQDALGQKRGDVWRFSYLFKWAEKCTKPMSCSAR